MSHVDNCNFFVFLSDVFLYVSHCFAPTPCVSYPIKVFAPFSLTVSFPMLEVHPLALNTVLSLSDP